MGGTFVIARHATHPIVSHYAIGDHPAGRPRHPRALLALAAAGARTKASALADELGTTPGFLTQAMTPLVALGWVRSDPGPAGGYTLVAALDDVSVLDVIEGIEGPTDTGRCVLEPRPCSGGGPCALHQPWSRARGQLLAELAATPLASLGRTTPRKDRR